MSRLSFRFQKLIGAKLTHELLGALEIRKLGTGLSILRRTVVLSSPQSSRPGAGGLQFPPNRSILCSSMQAKGGIHSIPEPDRILLTAMEICPEKSETPMAFSAGIVPGNSVVSLRSLNHIPAAHVN
jgi:hypothetical protein